MAILSDRMNSRLTLVLNTGNDMFGFPILKKKTYSRVKPSASDDAVFAVANAIGSLQAFELYGVERTDTSALEME